MLEKFKILGKTLKYHGHIVDFYAYDLQVPNGNKAQWDIIEHKGAALSCRWILMGKLLWSVSTEGLSMIFCWKFRREEETVWRKSLSPALPGNWKRR